MLEHKRIVLTGGPSSGKTSLLNHIQHPDTHCFEEVSRDVISKALIKGVKQPFLDNPLGFSEALFERRLHDYFEDKKNKIHVYDRGIHDVVAYLNAIGGDVPCGMLDDCSKYCYGAVFVFPPWDAIFTQDAERMEVFVEAIDFHKALLETYTNFGMQCIEVPKLSIEERFRFILNHL
ncbi:MAG: ATPase [Flavobacteriaceae bacterium]|nr:ATPase [Flavobacteriaceae bacterium]|tara:strand:+ start:594 stop:1124 length:531 start_codon:yes stop_codon:yes gene_type:complete